MQKRKRTFLTSLFIEFPSVDFGMQQFMNYYLRINRRIILQTM